MHTSSSTSAPWSRDTTTHTPSTVESLLDDLAHNPDSERFDEFARLYEPVLRRYARQAQIRLRSGMCESDQDDLVQEAFIAVRRALPQFRYDRAKGRFRNYLSLTIRNLALRILKKKGKSQILPPEDLDAFAASDADAETQEEMFSVWSLAYAQVVARRSFTPNTLAIFKSHVLEGIPVGQVAEEFKTSSGAVYQIKDRILRAVRSELAAARPAGGGLAELHEELLRRAAGGGRGK